MRSRVGDGSSACLACPRRRSSAPATRRRRWPRRCAGSGSSASTAPSACAAAGMPQTTLVGSSWPMVSAPASRIVRSPAAPSRPMPVSSTPTALRAAGRGGAGEGRVDPGHVELAVRRRAAARPAAPGAAAVFRPAGATCTTPGTQPPAVLGHHDRQRRQAVQPGGQALDEAVGHVLHDEHRHRQVGGQVAEDRGERRRPAGRGADDDDAGRCRTPAAARRRLGRPARRVLGGGQRVDVPGRAPGAQPVARVGDDPHPAGDPQVAAQGGDVLRRARQRVQGADHVDRAGGQGGRRVLGHARRRRRRGSAGCP